MLNKKMAENKVLLDTIKEEDKYYDISDVRIFQEGCFAEIDGVEVDSPCYKKEQIKEEVQYKPVIVERYKADIDKRNQLDDFTSDREDQVEKLKEQINQLDDVNDVEIQEYNALSNKLSEQEDSGFIKEEDWVKSEEPAEEPVDSEEEVEE